MYVVDPGNDVFINAGLHVPFTPFVEVEGNAGATAFWQSGLIGLNSGVTIGSVFTIIVMILPHWPELGVKV